MRLIILIIYIVNIMETLPIEIIRKIKLFCVYNPVAEMIRKKREIYSLDDNICDEEFVDDYLWGFVVLRFENEFGILEDDDELTLM